MLSKGVLKFISIIMLSFNASVDCISFSQLRLSTAESPDCPTLCADGLTITAIASIEGTPQLLLISGECAFIVDMSREDCNQRRRGFKHNMALTDIQDMFIVGNHSNIEFVNLYASGTLVQVIASNGTNGTEDLMLSNVFEGLNTDLDLPIDAAFVWTSKRIAYIIQGSKYWAFELSEGWIRGAKQLSDAYPRSIADFGLSDNHKITAAFSDSTKIYFVSMDLVHEFHVSDVDSKTGLFNGYLCQKTMKLKDFLKCSKSDAPNRLSWVSVVDRAISRMSDSLSEYYLLLAFVALAAIIIGLSLLALILMSHLEKVPYISDSKSYSMN